MSRVLLFLALGACGFSINGSTVSDGNGSDGTSDDAAITDDASIDGPPIDMMVIAWSAPQELGISDCDDPTLTGDMLEIWFDRASDVYHASRSSIGASWSVAQRVDELSSANIETTPEVSADGRFMTISRGVGNNDIYISSRATRADPWSNPVTVNDVNTIYSEACAVISTDRTMMALTSTRNPPQLSSDIFFSTRPTPQDPWGEPVVNAELSSAVQDGSIFLSGDKLTACFDSVRAGGAPDIYCATRSSPTAIFSAPAPITEVNTAFNEEDVWLSPDGKTMIFYSNRDGLAKLWYSTRP